MSGLQGFYRRLARNGPDSIAEQLLYVFLLPFSMLYRELMRLRAALYRWRVFSSYRASVPIISVGNLAVGGTGKTPVVDYLIKFCLAQGRQVAVVSRGYGGRKHPGVQVVSGGKGLLLEPEQCGDEPYLLARRNPQALVLVSPKRADAVRQAVEEFGAEIVLLDDGFQHLAVQRDFDIVLLDAQRPLGNGQLLPAGLLREPVSALGRGDLFLLTRCDNEAGFDLPVKGPVLHCRHALADHALNLKGQQIPLASLGDKRGIAFAGIAEPAGFFSSLKDKGLGLVFEISFADHCSYGESELRQLTVASLEADYLITTEKDAVKLSALNLPLPCYQVPLILEFREPGSLEGFLRPLVCLEKKVL
ncbi:MAG: tetraacyldisaccharide 4'-kinase [Desulfuromonadales bacterium C00003094]|nr:MAG: tetraacyldisaccharide 4'-kinase [Desulfuromonadales bacterium C00003094]